METMSNSEDFSMEEDSFMVKYDDSGLDMSSNTEVPKATKKKKGAMNRKGSIAVLSEGKHKHSEDLC